jgi:hypothetical protein
VIETVTAEALETEVSTDEVWSFVLGSEVVEVIVAVFVKIVPLGVRGSTVVTIWKTAEPGGRSGRVQFTVPLVPGDGVAQFHPGGAESELNVIPGGSGSFTLTLAASSGPSLETARVYVSIAPAATGSLSALFWMEIFAVWAKAEREVATARRNGRRVLCISLI